MSFVLLVDERWVFRTDFGFDGEYIDIVVPEFDFFIQSLKDCWLIKRQHEADSKPEILPRERSQLDEPEVLPVLNKTDMCRIMNEEAQVNMFEESFEDVGVSFGFMFRWFEVLFPDFWLLNNFWELIVKLHLVVNCKFS